MYGRDDMVFAGRKTNADNWPLYGQLGRETIREGGFAICAHGGYSQAIHADFVQKRVNAVELLQFGVYRGIGLTGWYDILNIGYRFPCVGASDYPACRKLGDCQTFVRLDGHESVAEWLKAASEGRSFVTNGPMLLLEVEGKGPGEIIRLNGTGPHRVRISVRVISHVPRRCRSCKSSPAARSSLRRRFRQTHRRPVDRDRADDRAGQSSWIAARGREGGSLGRAGRRSHTNPVYVDIGEKCLQPRLTRSTGFSTRRANGDPSEASFAEKARVLDDFQKSRDILLRIRQARRGAAGGVPDDWIEDNRSTAAIDPSRRSHREEELKRFLEPLPALLGGCRHQNI